MKVEIHGRTDVGMVRENNEDSIYYDINDICSVAAVADGMGGHRGGEVASRIAVTVLEEFYKNGALTTPRFIKQAFEQANKQVFDRSVTDNNLLGMGSTLSAMVIKNDEAYVAHIGDSRIYLLREGNLIQVTDDHTLAQVLVEQNFISEAEAMVSPNSHVLTRTIGTHRDESPDVLTYFLKPGDVFLLCSDGLSNHVANDEIRDILLNPALTDDVRLNVFISTANERGGRDNISVVIVRIKDVI